MGVSRKTLKRRLATTAATVGLGLGLTLAASPAHAADYNGWCPSGPRVQYSATFANGPWGSWWTGWWANFDVVYGVDWNRDGRVDTTCQVRETWRL